jgi:hypothetical protein
MNKKAEIKAILLELLRYEWSPRDNSRTTSLVIDSYVNRIVRVNSLKLKGGDSK